MEVTPLFTPRRSRSTCAWIMQAFCSILASRGFQLGLINRHVPLFHHVSVFSHIQMSIANFSLSVVVMETFSCMFTWKTIGACCVCPSRRLFASPLLSFIVFPSSLLCLSPLSPAFVSISSTRHSSWWLLLSSSLCPCSTCYVSIALRLWFSIIFTSSTSRHSLRSLFFFQILRFQPLSSSI